MTWRSLASPVAIKLRRRVVAPAVFYGLSLAVRFTSAAGEEVEIPPQPAQRTHPVISIMTVDGAHLPHLDCGAKPAQPILLRHGWPPRSSPPGCVAP